MFTPHRPVARMSMPYIGRMWVNPRRLVIAGLLAAALLPSGQAALAANKLQEPPQPWIMDPVPDVRARGTLAGSRGAAKEAIAATHYWALRRQVDTAAGPSGRGTPGPASLAGAHVSRRWHTRSSSGSGSPATVLSMSTSSCPPRMRRVETWLSK